MPLDTQPLDPGSLPVIVAGPIVRRVSRQRLTVWSALTQGADVTLSVWQTWCEPLALGSHVPHRATRRVRGGAALRIRAFLDRLPSVALTELAGGRAHLRRRAAFIPGFANAGRGHGSGAYVMPQATRARQRCPGAHCPTRSRRRAAAAPAPADRRPDLCRRRGLAADTADPPRRAGFDRGQGDRRAGTARSARDEPPPRSLGPTRQPSARRERDIFR